METKDNVTPLNAVAWTALPRRSTGDLDLTALPARLDDETLELVEAIARGPLPDLPSADERHFAKCLRIMLAVLPRQNTDEIGGELFVEAYRRQLAAYPNDAISHLADRATATCRWFPTIAECLDILRTWTRNDEARQYRDRARSMARQERNARAWEDTPEPAPVPRAEIGRMTPEMLTLGLNCGALERDADGNVQWADES